MTSPAISTHDFHAMAAACGSVLVAALPVLVLLREAQAVSSFAALATILLALLFLFAGLRMGLTLASGKRGLSPLLLSFACPLLGAVALVLPVVPGLCLLVLVFLIQAHGDGLAVERGHVPRGHGLCMNLVAGAAVIVLLAALTGTLT